MVSLYRKHHKDVSSYFSQEGNWMYCNHLGNLLEALGQQHDPKEWRLFIESLKVGFEMCVVS
jgi:hypothetical protein